MLRFLSLLLFFLLFSLTSNLGFLLLSEELLVFFSSLLFVALVVAALRKATRLYFFQRAYQVLLVFLLLLRISAWLLLQLRCSLAILFSWLKIHSFRILLGNAAFNAILLLVLTRKTPRSAVPFTHLLGDKRQKPLPLLLTVSSKPFVHGQN